jgi:hypothetical protein
VSATVDGVGRRFARAVLVVLAVGVLFAAGTAAAGVDLKGVLLKPGQCVTVKVANLRVCAAKAKPVTKVVTSTVTAPPVTITSPPVTVTAPPVTVTVTVTTTPTPKVAFPDGTYRVGPDIVAGTYRSAASTDACYWERLSGFGGTLAEIIANFYGTGPTIVTISPSDAGFRSERCGGWEKIG